MLTVPEPPSSLSPSSSTSLTNPKFEGNIMLSPEQDTVPPKPCLDKLLSDAHSTLVNPPFLVHSMLWTTSTLARGERSDGASQTHSGTWLFRCDREDNASQPIANAMPYPRSSLDSGSIRHRVCSRSRKGFYPCLPASMSTADTLA